MNLTFPKLDCDIYEGVTYIKPIIYELLITDCNGKKYKKLSKKHELLCDNCQMVYIANKCYNTRCVKSKLHFCSLACSKKSFKNGKLRKSLLDSIVNKYDGYYVETDEFKKKNEDSVYKKFGVKRITDSIIVQEKIKNTNLLRYGRETFAGSLAHKNSIDFVEVSRKGWETKLRNNKGIPTSKQEKKLHSILSTIFQEDDIQPQAPFSNQRIDFYIKSINLYIQVDGVYWHGLNRPVEDIKKYKTSQDVKIYRQIIRDQLLNEYTNINNINLLRFTDEDIDQKTTKEIYARIRTYMY